MNLTKEDMIEMKVEIPSGSSNKYEFDVENNKWNLDRVFYGTNSLPAEYGYIENTLDYDGDPLDILCITTFSTFPGCCISVRVLGVLKMIDQGKEDHKIIAVPSSKTDPRFSHIKSIEDLGHKKNEIVDFFSNYKNLENKKVLVEGFAGLSEAFEVLNKCKELFVKFQEKVSNGYSKDKALEETFYS